MYDFMMEPTMNKSARLFKQEVVREMARTQEDACTCCVIEAGGYTVVSDCMECNVIGGVYSDNN